MAEQQILRIGTAGWGIPLAQIDDFPNGNSVLERYSQVFNSVEINSSFHRSHAKNTYARWSAATPVTFIFAVKMPKEITHTLRLVDCNLALDQFLHEVSGLQDKLGPILIQLPPSLDFNRNVADDFLKLLRAKFSGRVALEARNLSWFDLQAVSLLKEYEIVQVITDPAIAKIKIRKDQLFKYYRLHGSPKMYSSSYQTTFLESLRKRLDHKSIVIFDNTMFGNATLNALYLKNNLNFF